MAEREPQKLSIQDLSGSFPFQISKADFKRIGITTLLVAASAVLTYFSQTVIPSLHTDNPFALWAVAVVTGLIQTAQSWITDTRSDAEKQRLPYREFLRLRKLES